ncbi:Crp/Fnr family transcriptional regulator [Spirochaeta isovalerica]|uniref:CRP/FNR family transcriptional regulator n=1 Tax=Spirochaeta isovalerica TaxID=150 RepID=A0A841RFV0_9SPIO|nr:Crp/Fnr family transcriptional regulator [Spirochaeta isovalerica]MBB6482097.1 CRP/FNR family transcriptional regulator [Spirochaeta isovalerica]
MDIEAFLSRTELFSGLMKEHREEILREGTVAAAEKNEQIFREGESGSRVFLLLSGSVKLYRGTEEGRDIIVRILSGGELFGEVVLYLDDIYPVSAMALEDSNLFYLNKKSFYRLMENEDFRNDFIAVLMNKQRYLSGRIHYLSAYDVEDRFFRYLKENYGEKEVYLISLSKKDLASAIGTIPETLSRLLARLKKRGIANWEKKELMLKEDFWKEYD